MATSTVRSGRAPGRALKSPLAAPGASAACSTDNFGSLALTPGRAALTDREATLAEFQGYLRTVNNRDGRPFEEKTITAYSDPVKSLDKWMTANGIPGDFEVADTALLNRFFREYYLEHGQGGTHTQQRNLIQMFNFLEHERGCPSPYTDGLNRYAAVKGRPRPCPASSSMTCSMSPEAGGRGTSRRRATTRSSASCAARASAGWNSSPWSCTRSRPT